MNLGRTGNCGGNMGANNKPVMSWCSGTACKGRPHLKQIPMGRAMNCQTGTCKMVPKRWYSESTKYLANGDQVTKTCHNGVCTTKTIKAKPGSQGGCNGGCGGKPEVQKEGNGLPEGANGKVPVAKTELPETTAVMTTQAMITQAVTTLFAMTQAPTTPAPKSVCSSKAA